MSVRIGDFFRALFWLLNYFRIPLAFCLLLIVLAGSAQISELTKDQMWQSNLGQFVLSWVAALAYLAAFFWVVVAPIEDSTSRAPWTWGRDILAGAIGSAPLVFNAVMWTRPDDSPSALDWAGKLLAWGGPAVAGLAAFVAGACLVILAQRLYAARLSLITPESVRLGALLTGAAGFAIATLVMFVASVEVPRALGTLALIYIFLSLLLISLISLEYWLSRVYIPVFSVVLIALLVSSYLSYSSDRIVRRLGPAS
jgi:hypothetical protein